jgi:hypothetical protein
MRRISSANTFFFKRVFPAFWFGFLGLWTLLAVGGLLANGTRGSFPAFFLVVPFIMAGFGYLLMRRLIFDLVDEVYDCGAELLVRNAGKEERIPLQQIINVGWSTFSNPPRVTLSVREPRGVGRELSFIPPRGKGWPIPKRSEVIDELIERVDAARRTALPAPGAESR